MGITALNKAGNWKRGKRSVPDFQPRVYSSFTRHQPWLAREYKKYKKYQKYHGLPSERMLPKSSNHKLAFDVSPILYLYKLRLASTPSNKILYVYSKMEKTCALCVSACILKLKMEPPLILVNIKSCF